MTKIGKGLKPLATWDGDSIVEGLAWHSRLDGRYLVEVRYDPDGDGYQGTLAIFDHQDADRVVHSEPVGIAYAARFGPDVDDVATWQERSADVVDALPKP